MATQPPAPPPSSQRAYRGTCPNCGATVDLRSAASAFAVCPYCRSTLVRDGAALRRIGLAAELFSDFSPLQLGVAGRFLEAGFTIVGRLQYVYDGGIWNEWHLVFDAGRNGWLSEDNGRYVLSFEAALGTVPAAAALRVGATATLAGSTWTVASAVRARPGAVEGELAAAPAPGGVLVVELRNPRGEVAALEFGAAAQPPLAFIGRAVELADLDLKGLRPADDGARAMSVRAVPCPQCGAALAPTLASTKSIVCGQCHAVVDVSRGLGADLAYYAQVNADQSGLQSQIPLGAVGRLALNLLDGPGQVSAAAEAWQVVGYVERCTVPSADAGEVEFWREYLLYQRARGFAFLVDANDGWSWSMPLAGAPQAGSNGSVQWQGTTYRELYRYVGRVTYVLGEFYWNLAHGETTANIDYADGTGQRRLNREQTDEIVWSGGATLDAVAVARAFGLADAAPLLRDATPLHAGGSRLVTLVLIALVVLLVVLAIAQCSGSSCSQVRDAYGAQSDQYRACQRASGSGAAYRSAGGAFGGFGAAGGHK